MDQVRATCLPAESRGVPRVERGARPFRVLTPPRWSATALVPHLRRLSEYTDLLAVLCRHRISVRYKQSLLGGLWALLQPVSMMLVFTAVFSRLAPVPSDGVPYAVFAYAGILPWTFFSSGVSSGTSSLVGHAQLVTKVYFPREILPLSYIVAAFIDLMIGGVVLLALLVGFDVPITGRILLAAPIAATLAACSLACSLVLSAVHVRFRDVGVALPMALQLLMFVSPVLYPLGLVPAGWRSLYMLNPLAGLVDAFRRSVLGLPLDDTALAVAVVITAVALPSAYLIFKHAEVSVADVI